MTKHDLVIFGCGGFGREVLETIKQLEDYFVIGFLDDNKRIGSKCNGIKVLGDIDWLKKRDKHLAPLGVVVAVGNPYSREKIVSRIKPIKNIWYPPIIHPGVILPKSTTIGDGTIIQNGCYISCNVTISEFTHVNYLTVGGHDASIGRFVTLSPGSKVMGNVVLGDRVFFGVNASTNRGIKIDDDSVIGGASFALNDVPKQSCYYGVPAKYKRKNVIT